MKSAFPQMYKHPTTGLIIEDSGISLRDYLATHAMAAFISSHAYSEDDVPGLSYQMADWMIAAAEEKKDE
jgi:hypothetical protein